MSLTSQVYSDHLVSPAYPILCLQIHITMEILHGRIIFNILNSKLIPFDRNSKYVTCILIVFFFKHNYLQVTICLGVVI